MRAISVILLAAVVGSRAEAEAEPSYGHGYTGSALSHRLGHGLGYGHRLGYGHGYSGYSGYVQPARSYVSHHRLHKREADPEPEPEAEASYGYSGYSYGTSHPTYGYPAYGSHGYGHGYSGYPSYSRVSVHRIHKREASPEPEPEAEASYGHSGYSYGTTHSTYGYPAYGSLGYGRGYSGYPSYSHVSVHRIHKREADAEPEPEAEASYGHSGYSYGTSHSTYGYPAYGSLGYGRGYSAYPARSYVSVHRVHKREADPEPAAEADPSYGYSHVARGYGYPSYAYHPSAYGSATSYVGPRVHGARIGYTHGW